MTQEIRLLRKEDIDVRVAQTNTYNNKDGSKTIKTTLLLYKNARVDMKILDELYTPMGWKRTHRLIGDRLYCLVEVWDAERKEWIGKEDVGTESNTEAEKGQASDSFKRACVNWGIGRELYSAPKVNITLNEGEYGFTNNGNVRVYASFFVGDIQYDEQSRTIKSLTIVDKYGNVRFPAQSSQRTYAPAPAVAPAPAIDPAPIYKPMETASYDKFIEASAKGNVCASGKTAFQRWQEMTNAGNEQIAQYKNDVVLYCKASGIEVPTTI